MSKNLSCLAGCSLRETKRRLSQYKDLLQEIGRDRMRLAQLTGRLARLNPACLPEGVAIPQHDLIDYRDRIEENVVRCMELVKDIQDFINGIEESDMRRLFTLRYLNGYTWQKIAFSVGAYDESVPRKKHDRYLKLAFASDTSEAAENLKKHPPL